jgi:pilus assembly protein Flp/PilA
MGSLFSRFLKHGGGATAVEYGLVVAMLIVTIVTGIGRAGDALMILRGDNESQIARAPN